MATRIREPPRLSSPTPAAARPDRPWTALGWAVASALAFSLMAAQAKALSGTFSASELVFARSLVTLAIVGSLLRRARAPLCPPGLGLLVWRGVTGFLAVWSFYVAIAGAPLYLAAVLKGLTPLFVLGLSALVLGERLRPELLAWVGLTVVGAGLLVHGRLAPAGHSGAAVPWLPVAAGVFSALSGAVGHVSVRAASARFPPDLIVGYFAAVGLVASIPGTIASFHAPTGVELLQLLLLGVLACVAQLSLTRAFGRAMAGLVGAMTLLRPWLAAAWGLLLFGERANAEEITGMVIVAIGLVALVLRARVRSRAASGPLASAGSRGA